MHMHNNIISDAFFENEDLKVIIIASEVPFVGDDPESIQEKAEKVINKVKGGCSLVFHI